MAEQGEITGLLRQAQRGDAEAEARLLELLYRELRQMAGAFLARERPGHTLQATALVHEAYLRMGLQRNIEWQSRTHFFAAAAQAMRRALVDCARARNAKRRGSGAYKIDLEEGTATVEAWREELLDIDAALDRLNEIDPRQARVVEMKFFAGLTDRQIAETIGVSERTIKREWQIARAWLHGQLSGAPKTEPAAKAVPDEKRKS